MTRVLGILHFDPEDLDLYQIANKRRNKHDGIDNGRNSPEKHCTSFKNFLISALESFGKLILTWLELVHACSYKERQVIRYKSRLPKQPAGPSRKHQEGRY